MIAAAIMAAAVGHALGTAEAACRPDEPGPALSVSVAGLKDRKGRLRIELYPANDTDFLADAEVLVAANKPFRRWDIATPESGPVEMCIRAPETGAYAVVVMHDRNNEWTFKPFVDGAGFPGNPKIGFSKPKAARVTTEVGPGVSHIDVVMNYWNGLAFRPVHK